MKLKDLKNLLNESRIFQNNFVKIDIVKKELALIFVDNFPKIEFDNDGLFIKIDDFTYSKYKLDEVFDKFSLSEGIMIDEIKNIKKYYIEFTTPIEPEETESTEEKPESSGEETREKIIL